jgi:hypothetical protein
MSESNFTQGLDIVRDKLKEVQQAVGTPGKDGKGAGQDKAVRAGFGKPGEFPPDAPAGQRAAGSTGPGTAVA